MRQGESWTLLEAEHATAGKEVKLLVSSESSGWCLAVVRLEKCDSTSQYGTLCEAAEEEEEEEEED